MILKQFSRAPVKVFILFIIRRELFTYLSLSMHKPFIMNTLCIVCEYFMNTFTGVNEYYEYFSVSGSYYFLNIINMEGSND